MHWQLGYQVRLVPAEAWACSRSGSANTDYFPFHGTPKEATICVEAGFPPVEDLTLWSRAAEVLQSDASDGIAGLLQTSATRQRPAACSSSGSSWVQRRSSALQFQKGARRTVDCRRAGQLLRMPSAFLAAACCCRLFAGVDHAALDEDLRYAACIRSSDTSRVFLCHEARLASARLPVSAH